MADPPTPAVQRRRPRDLNHDAFYAEEREADSSSPTGFKQNASTGNHLNRFESLTEDVSMPNALEASEVIPAAHRNRFEDYRIFVPSALRNDTSKTARVTLLFCVGSEMNRHGLRKYFASRGDDRVLITIPGREAGWIKPPAAWGIGISKDQIDDLFHVHAKLPGMKWEVRVLAGYSTGYRGLNGTVNQKLIPLDKVEKVIFYDCLYRADQPPPGTNTKRMLDTVKDATGDRVRIITYEVTGGGTPRPLKAPVPTTPITNLINLKPKSQKLQALQLARVLDNGLRDGFFGRSKVPKPILELIDAPLPVRGALSSLKNEAEFGPVVQTLDEWAEDNKTAIAKITSTVRKQAIDLIRAKWLVGWQVPNVGELQHDQFIPEFAWEHLVG